MPLPERISTDGIPDDPEGIRVAASIHLPDYTRSGQPSNIPYDMETRPRGLGTIPQT